VLVEALDLLKDSRPNLHLLLVGGVHRSGADYDAKLRADVAARGLSDRVIWTGPRRDVPDLMNAMDVVVHTSVRGEPFGRVIIEGMAVGKPVIATRAGGVPEFVHDGEDALLVEPGNARELADTLARLLGDASERVRLSRAARASAERFSLPRHVEAMTDVFERAAGQGSTATSPAREHA
jgi:glycosyltransferase involved in cell wall biosynthesis